MRAFVIAVLFLSLPVHASLTGGQEMAQNLEQSIPRSGQLLTGNCKTLAKPTIVVAEGGTPICFAQFACGRENDPFERELMTVTCKAAGKFSCPPLADCLKDNTVKAETANAKWQSHTPSNYSHTVTHLDGYPELETKQLYSNEISLYATGLNSRGRQVAKPGTQPDQREEERAPAAVPTGELKNK